MLPVQYASTINIGVSDGQFLILLLMHHVYCASCYHMHTAQGYPNSKVGLLPASELRPLVIRRKCRCSLSQLPDWLRRYCCFLDRHTHTHNALNNHPIIDAPVKSVGQHKFWAICFISCNWQDKSENPNKNSDALRKSNASPVECHAPCCC